MHDLHEPHYEWLRRRWALPESRIDLVRRLLDAEAEGSTALDVEPAEIAGDWGQALTGLAADAAQPVQPRPLVHFSDGTQTFLQSWRGYATERAIAAQLLRRLAAAPGQTAATGIDSALAQLFPGAAPDDRQVLAARTALSQRVVLVTGGPGTGKTYTLARILALLLSLADGRPPRIGLAAPTGKAADRMREAIRDSIEQLPGTFRPHAETIRRAAQGSTTLHSLLSYNPSTGNCARNAASPLPCDVLILDEASMIDVYQWRALLDALPDAPHTRLIVLGDPFQLESVGAGDVLYQLVASPALAAARVELVKTRRFDGRPHIRELAEALAAHDARRATQLLRSVEDAPPAAGLSWCRTVAAQNTWQHLPAAIREKIADVATAATPEAALDALRRVRILAAHRDTRLGALGLSESINAYLRKSEPVRAPNEPIIVNVNDPETGLRNGSVGILHTDASGHRAAYFEALREGAPLQRFAIGQLPDYSAAWALTIHRSQGSEFDDILVLLPDEDSPLATRELIYTAITRAKQSVYLHGPLATIERAIADQTRRASALGHWLNWRREGDSNPRYSVTCTPV